MAQTLQRASLINDDNLYSVFHANAFDWLERAKANSIEAVVTDPPYGLVEYSGGATT